MHLNLPRTERYFSGKRKYDWRPLAKGDKRSSLECEPRTKIKIGMALRGSAEQDDESDELNVVKVDTSNYGNQVIQSWFVIYTRTTDRFDLKL